MTNLRGLSLSHRLKFDPFVSAKSGTYVYFAKDGLAKTKPRLLNQITTVIFYIR